MVEQGRGPSVVAVVERALGERDDRVDATERRDVALRERRGRVGPQPCRVAVEPAEVALGDRLHVVVDGTVVPAGVPGVLECGRQGEVLRGFGPRDAAVEQPDGLVVQVRVEIALQREERDEPLLAPRRPVVRGEEHVGAVTVEVDGLGEVARPRPRVAHQRAAQREQVVQRVGRVLREAEGAELRQVEVELRGRLAGGRELELDLDPVQLQRLPRVRDEDGRRHHADVAGRVGRPEARADLPSGAALERGAEHVGGAADHRGAGIEVLGCRVLDEALGCDDLDPPGIHVLLRRDAEHAAEVVDVRVGEEHRAHGALAPVGGVQGERGRGRLGRHQGVHDDDAAVALDHRHDGQVEAAHLFPSAVVMNAKDAWAMKLEKDADGRYLNPAFGEGTAWGLPVVSTYGIAQGKFIVGGFVGNALIWQRKGVEVRRSTEDRDNFVKNLVTILMEERLNLEVLRPEGIVAGTLTTVP